MKWKQRAQEEIFNTFDWWDQDSLLWKITQERCDYIQACIERKYGKEALKQQEILDIGSGGGLICEDLAHRGATMYGIEPSQGALEIAREHTKQSGLGECISYMRGRAEALPYADGSFSVITCFDVLEHVQDLRATVREIARVLAAGGIFSFDTINRTMIARAVLIWYGEHFLSGGLTPGLHKYQDFIQPQELRTLLIECGLQVQQLTGFMPIGWRDGQLKMGPGRFMGVVYAGYATKPL